MMLFLNAARICRAAMGLDYPEKAHKAQGDRYRDRKDGRRAGCHMSGLKTNVCRDSAPAAGHHLPAAAGQPMLALLHLPAPSSLVLLEAQAPPCNTAAGRCRQFVRTLAWRRAG